MTDNQNSIITYGEIQRVICRCMTAHPVDRKTLALHPDASLITEILGEMICRRLDAIPARVVQGEHLAALERWRDQ